MITTSEVFVEHPQVLQSYKDLQDSNQHACTRVIPLVKLKNHRELTTVGFRVHTAPPREGLWGLCAPHPHACRSPHL